MPLCPQHSGIDERLKHLERETTEQWEEISRVKIECTKSTERQFKIFIGVYTSLIILIASLVVQLTK